MLRTFRGARLTHRFARVEDALNLRHPHTRYFMRDQRRQPLGERAIVRGQLERADLRAFVDDRQGDRFT
jgi:hypothetical protein